MNEAGTWHATIAADALAEGEMVGVEIGEVRIAIYNVGGVHHATANVCTHAFALLSDGWLEDDVVECPLHGGRFNVVTGQAGGDPVECDLQVFAVKVVDGTVMVCIPEARSAAA